MEDSKETSIPIFKWFIVGSAFCICFLVDGIILSFGILLVELVGKYNLQRASTAVLGALVNATMHLIGPIAGLLTDKYGCRCVAIIGTVLSFVGFFSSTFVPDFYYLYFTYGVLGGCGLGLMYLPANVTVVKHFTKHRALATGILTCGSGVGSFAFNELFVIFSEMYGWNGSLLLTAGIILHGVPCALLFVKPDDNVTRSCNKHKRITCVTNTGLEKDVIIGSKTVTATVKPEIEIDSNSLLKVVDKVKVNKRCEEMFSLSLFKDPKFSVFIVSTFAMNLAFLTPFHLLPDQALELGMNKSEAAWLVSVIGITNAAGRLVIAVIADREIVKRERLLKMLIFTAGVATALSPLLNTYATKMVYSCVFGLTIGGYIGLIPVVLADMLGPQMIAKSFGIVMLTVGVSSMLATPIGGIIFDETGSYDIAFIVAGIEMIISACILIVPECCCLKVGTIQEKIHLIE